MMSDYVLELATFSALQRSWTNMTSYRCGSVPWQSCAVVVFMEEMHGLFCSRYFENSGNMSLSMRGCKCASKASFVLTQVPALDSA